MSIKKFAKMYAVNYVLNAAVSCATYPLFKKAHQDYVDSMRPNPERALLSKEHWNEVKGEVYFMAMLGCLNLVVNKTVTGHFVRVWKD